MKTEALVLKKYKSLGKNMIKNKAQPIEYPQQGMKLVLETMRNEERIQIDKNRMLVPNVCFILVIKKGWAKQMLWYIQKTLDALWCCFDEHQCMSAY